MAEDKPKETTPVVTSSPAAPAVEPAKPVIAQQPSQVFKWDATRVANQLKFVEDFYLEYSGKPLYNPHFYLEKEVNPLKKRLFMGEESEALHNAVFALKMEIKPMPNLVAAAEELKKQAALRPQGDVLPGR